MKCGVGTLFLCLGLVFCYEDKCNLLECIYHSSEFLTVQGEPQVICGKLKKSASCFWSCLKNTPYANINIQNGLSAISGEACENDMAIRIEEHGKCILTHIHELIACFLSTFNSIASVKRSASKHLTCRKFLMAQRCTDFLTDACAESAMELVDDMQGVIVKDTFNFACSNSTEAQSYGFGIKSPFENAWKKLSKCFSENNEEISRCYSSISSVTTMSCSELGRFLSCVDSALRPVCGSEVIASSKDYFYSVLDFFKQNPCSSSDESTYAIGQSKTVMVSTLSEKVVSKSVPTTTVPRVQHEDTTDFQDDAEKSSESQRGSGTPEFSSTGIPEHGKHETLQIQNTEKSDKILLTQSELKHPELSDKSASQGYKLENFVDCKWSILITLFLLIIA